MRHAHTLVIIIACVAVLVAGWILVRPRPVPAPVKPDTVYAQLTAKSGAVAETVLVTNPRFRAERDSLRRLLAAALRTRDTVRDTVLRTVDNYLERIDTVFARCDACAAQLLEHKRVADSIIRVVRDSLARCKAEKAAAKSERKWWGLVGAAAGIAVCKG